MASRSSAPWMACSQKGSICRITSAERIVASSSAPSAAPQTVPEPPKMATPPTTTADTAASSMPVPATASSVPKREA